MNAEELHKDAARLGEIVIRILFMKHNGFQQWMTLFGYMVVKVIKSVAYTQKHDPDKEMSKFIDYLMDIYALEKRDEQSEQKASIINLN